MQCEMSNNRISTYKFKPFQFTVLEKILDPQKRPLIGLGNRLVSNNAYLFSFGGSNCRTTKEVLGLRISLAKQELWKYSFDLGEWKIMKCQNVPESSSSPVTLSGNLIIKHGVVTGFASGDICYNRMYLGNLGNEFKENGMSFEDLECSEGSEDSGDLPSPLYNLAGVIIDGKYIYSISVSTGYEYAMDVHRFDMSTRKWELLHTSVGEPLKPRYPHEVLFYKGRICIFTGKQGGVRNVLYGFSIIHMFDVETKQWQLLPTKQDHRVQEPGYPITRSWHSCVQCPEQSNLVYLCGGFDGLRSFKDVWRFDFDTLQWEKLTECLMPRPVYSHSTTITPSGRMYCYGGIVLNNDDNVIDRDSRSHDITSAWITIPKLKDICWEAMLYYFKDQMFASSDAFLKKIGLPQEYYERIIEARRIC